MTEEAEKKLLWPGSEVGTLLSIMNQCTAIRKKSLSATITCCFFVAWLACSWELSDLFF